MKAIYKSIFFSVALLFGMASCDKDELPPTGPKDNAEKLVVGTYVGEWTRVTVGTDAVETGSGSITFSIYDDTKYNGDKNKDKEFNNVSEITLDSSTLDIGIDDPKTSVCNITILSSGEFTYWNQTSSNPFGTTFYGKVSTDGVATMNYTKTVREGRKEVTSIYSFTGRKQ